ncbi:alpha/beta hydrolase, partial [Tautonia sociabilis]
MGSDPRSAIGRAASALAAMLAVALATSAAALSPRQDAPLPQENSQESPPPAARPRAVPREKPARNIEEKSDAGGLRLPPANAAPGGLADRPGDDPLEPGALPAEGDRPAPARPADPNAPVVPSWPFLYELTLASFDGAPLAARYYPSQEGASAAVILLVHDLAPGRSIKDFDDPIEELDGKGLAGALQQEGYAVLALDLRGFGRSPSRLPEAQAASRRVGDLQAAYRFLLDRHNRRELNLAKLGVVGLGAGANLAASWLASPGGAVSIEGRTSDLAGLVLVSPRADLDGVPIDRAVSALAPRFPILLLFGSAD